MMFEGRKNKLFLLLLLLILFFGANFIFAQERNLEVQLPSIPGVETPRTVNTFLPDYVKYIFNFSILVSGLIAFAALIYGGSRYLTSAGSPTVMQDAKDRIFAAILGLIILLSSYLILTTVNPQLVMLSIPERVEFEPPEAPPPVPVSQQTLYAKEIPTGFFIDGTSEKYEGIMAKSRLERILKASEEIWQMLEGAQKTTNKIKDVSSQIKNAAEALKNLTDSCSCGTTYPTCGSPNRDCPSSSVCYGDPCGSVRGAITQQQALLTSLSQQLPALTTKLSNLITVMKEKAEVLAVEQPKLKTALAEVQEVEKIMKGCAFSISENDKPMVLLNFSTFWGYKEGLEQQKLVKKIEITKPWESLNYEDDEATFYCAETPLDTSLLKSIGGGNVEEFLKIENVEVDSSKVFCETAIPFGGILDNSEDIAQKLLDEMQKTIDEIPIIEGEISAVNAGVQSEINSAVSLSFLPDRCSVNNCRPLSGCATSCCGEPFCVACCIPRPCSGAPCPTFEIADALNGVETAHRAVAEASDNLTASYKKIAEADDEINNLIAGNKVHAPSDGAREPTWAYNLIEKELPVVRNGFGKCINSSADWAKFFNGQKILIKEITTCNTAKAVCRNIEENYECRGLDDPESYPDYFCAETESQF